MTIASRAPRRAAPPPAAPGRAGVVVEIAARRLADVRDEFGRRSYRSLADEAAERSALPGGAARPVA